MHLNNLRPAKGSRSNAKRVGRGIGCGNGKTCGRGHKGQKSRNGGFHKVGFEGGQMPLQRRLPKIGFFSRKAQTVAEVRLNELNAIDADVIDLAALKDANVVGKHVLRAKVILSGEVGKAVVLRGVGATRGARAAIEAAGGRVE